MSKGIITVLLHTVEYDTGNIVIDADAEGTLHDEIYYEIEVENSSGELTAVLEDDEENPINVDVSWKIVNPEAEQWKQIAATIREEYFKEIDEVTMCLEEAIKERYQWRQLAEKMYRYLLPESVISYPNEMVTGQPIGLVREYEELIKQTTHE